jgi:opacity protein-like surface antigen
MSINKFIKPVIATLLLPLGASAMSMGNGPASDTDYFYAGVKAGTVMPGNTQGNSDLQSVTGDKTYTAGVSFGRKFQDRFAVELEYMYRGKSDVDSSSQVGSANATNSWDVSANTFMVNMTADLLTGYAVRPYVKLGAGASSNNSSDYVFVNNGTTTTWKGRTTTEFAWNAGFGVNINTSKMIDTNIEYAYVDRGQFETNSGATILTEGGVSGTASSAVAAARTGKLRDQVVTVGLRFKF